MPGVIVWALNRENHMATKTEVGNALPRFEAGNIIANEPRAAPAESGVQSLASHAVIYLPDESKMSLPR